MLPFWKLTVTVKKPRFLVKIDEIGSIGERFKARRLQLKLRQIDAAMLVGVTEDAIRFWETGLSTPRIEHIPKVIAFLGYNPYPNETETLGGRIKLYRLLHGLSHKKMGKLLAVDGATVSTWETNKYQPSQKNLETIITLLKDFPKTSRETDSTSAEEQFGKE